ncbi:MAG: hypothetical protein AAF845_17740 [Bacteroidota bacterium]
MLRLLALAVLLPAVATASAQTPLPREIPFQGRLQDSGTPVTAATDVTFALFDVATGGTAIWTETQAVTPDADGAFAIRLGAVTDLPDNLGRPLWLEVAVPSGGSTQVLGPRTPFGAAPYALGLHRLTITPSTSPFSGYGPNLVGGSPVNTVGPNVGGATISGGGGTNNPNTVTEDYGTIGGGRDNTTSGFTSTVGGGQSNTASGDTNTIAGGSFNTASSSGSTIGGGSTNTASGFGGTVSGGAFNTASGFRSTIPGGRSNEARGSHSFAAGFYARAAHDGTFVWSDDSQPDADSLVSTGEDQFLIRAAGGVGIGINAPTDGQLRIVNEAGSGLSTATVRAENTSTGGGIAGYFEANGTDAAFVVGQSGAGDLVQTFASGNLRFRVQNNGDVTADGAFTGGGADFAEFFPLAASGTGSASESAASVAPGDLVGLRGGEVSLRTEAAEQVMIASSNPAFVGNPDAEAGGALVALVGQAEVRITGAASVGDLLVASGLDDGTARAVAPEAYRPEADGPVAGRVVALPEAGRAVALVGVDEAAALRAVVARQAATIETQAARLDTQQDRLDTQQAQIDLLTRRLDALTATASAD